MRGLFVTLEGIEGSGKSTQLARLASRLRRSGRLRVITSREPGGTDIGEKIRKLLLDARNTDIRSKSELFLYLAGRSQHLQAVIRPLLGKGSIILCDRFSDATVAYQGYGRGLMSPLFQRLVDYAADGIKPDLTILLDLNPRTALSRVRGRRVINRIDRETLAFHTRVRRGYRLLAKQDPRRIKIVNADASLAAVAHAIDQVVEPKIQTRRRKRRR